MEDKGEKFELSIYKKFEGKYFNEVEFADKIAIPDTERFNDKIAENAALLFYYGNEQAKWDELVGIMEHRLEVKESALAMEIRKSETKVTADAVKAQVANDGDIQKIKRALGVAEYQASTYKNAVTALNAQYKNLSNLSFNQSREKASSAGAGYQDDSGSEHFTKEQRKELATRLANRG